MVAAGPTKLAKKTTGFDTRTWFRAKVAADDVNRKNLQFLTLEPRFVRKVAAGPTKLQKKHQLLTLEPLFRAKRLPRKL